MGSSVQGLGLKVSGLRTPFVLLLAAQALA